MIDHAELVKRLRIHAKIYDDLGFYRKPSESSVQNLAVAAAQAAAAVEELQRRVDALSAPADKGMETTAEERNLWETVGAENLRRLLHDFARQSATIARLTRERDEAREVERTAKVVTDCYADEQQKQLADVKAAEADRDRLAAELEKAKGLILSTQQLVADGAKDGFIDGTWAMRLYENQGKFAAFLASKEDKPHAGDAP